VLSKLNKATVTRIRDTAGNHTVELADQKRERHPAFSSSHVRVLRQLTLIRANLAPDVVESTATYALNRSVNGLARAGNHDTF
jgi:hypothetical protein